MKKLLLSIVIFSLLFSCAGAESVDLSALSFADLLSLRSALDAEILSRPEWKEVTVPPGEYTVGIDIPAGVYSIEHAGKRSGNFCVWGAAVDDYKANGGLLINTTISKDNPFLARLVLKDGNVLETNTTILMTPYQGLGF